MQKHIFSNYVIFEV